MTGLLVSDIHAALGELLTTMEAQARPKSSGPAVVNAADIVDDVLSSDADYDVHALVEHPTFAACAQGLRKLGEHLHQLGGFQAMQDAVVAASSMNPQREALRIGRLDRAWDGIGDWRR